MHFVYILRCADDTLYCGWTTDLTRRLAAHNGGGGGAKYTRGRGPVTLVYWEVLPDKSAALRREIAIKKLTRQEKLALIEGFDQARAIPLDVSSLPETHRNAQTNQA